MGRIYKMFLKNKVILSIFIILTTLLFCEFIIHYLILIQCRWPTLPKKSTNSSILDLEKPLFAMFLADTHLLGPRNGHWFDKLRREWQMYRSFQTALFVHNPEVIFILGDLFDEGQWSNSEQFEDYKNRFHTIFSVPNTTKLYVLSGNHDIGFHYVITPYLYQRFADKMNAPNVRRITIKGNHFVLLNSMAFEGDRCFLCKDAEAAIHSIKEHLECSKRSNCTMKAIKKYSRPIILQHFPMFRESDAACNEIDEAPENIKNAPFKERWDCLSKEATNTILELLNPRLIIDGHTHHGCRMKHKKDIHEVTIPSFNWRNKDNPSYLLGIFTPNNYALEKCYMTIESTVITLYILSILVLFSIIILKMKRRYH